MTGHKLLIHYVHKYLLPRLAAPGSRNEPGATLRLKKLQNETQVSFCLRFLPHWGAVNSDRIG